jgi:hypothetical protein
MQQLKPNQVAGILKQLVDRQGKKCAVCQKPFTKRDIPVLDHDHDTGYIRGALHNSCNGIEGRVKALARRCHAGVSAYEFLKGLGAYLTRHEKPRVNLIHPTHMTEDAKRQARNAKARAARAKKKE